MSSSIPLRPRTISEILDAAFRLYRMHIVPFLGIAALLQVPLLVLQVLIQYLFNGAALADVTRYSSSAARASGASPLSGVPIGALATIYATTIGISLLQYLIVTNLLTGALARAIARSTMGEPVSILDAYRIGWRAFFALVGASLVLVLAAMVVIVPVLVVTIAVGVGLTAAGPRAATAGVIIAVLVGLALTLVLACGAIWLAVRVLFVTQTIVLEQCGPIAGLQRSWQLTRGAFWRTLLIVVLVTVLSYLLTGLPALIANLVLNFTRGAGDLFANSLITSIIAQVGVIVALPIKLCIYTLLYYDQRVRREGLDLELRAQTAATALA